HRRQPVFDGQAAQDVAEQLLVPAAGLPGLQAFAQVCAARADGQHVRRAAVFDLIDGVRALVDQAGVRPAEGDVQYRTARWDFQQAIVIGQRDVELVALHPPVVGQREADQARDEAVGDVAAAEDDAVDRVRVFSRLAQILGDIAEVFGGFRGELVDHYSTRRRMSTPAWVAAPS